MTEQMSRVEIAIWMMAGVALAALALRMTAAADAMTDHVLDKRVVLSPRGAILDRNGRPLAVGSIRERQYPLGEASLHPVGFATGVGSRAGLERSAHEYLSAGRTLVPRRYLNRDAADRPSTIVLSLESAWQEAAYRALAGRRGAFVLIDSATGELLASVSSPAVDPARVRTTSASAVDEVRTPWFDRALRGSYLPGSTFKLWTSALIVEANRTGQRVLCRGSTRVGSRTIRCMSTHGAVNLAQALRVSCNAYFVTQTLTFTHEQWLAAARRGLGTGFVELPAEFSEWNRALAAIGQGQAVVSPVAMAAAVAALYNNAPPGEPLRARLMLTGPDAAEPPLPSVEGWSRTTREALRTLLDGSAVVPRRRAALPAGWKLRGAKTGTAERPGRLGNLAWLVGAIDDPEGRTLAFALVVEGVRRVSADETPGILSAAVSRVVKKGATR